MKKLKLIIAAVVIGALDALAFKGFEYVVNHGTNYIWNELFNSDQTRWVVIPLAVGLSLLFSLLVKLVRQKRMVAPELNPLDNQPAGRVTLKQIAIVTVVGAASLLAGASLGPEASLVAITAGLGIWMAYSVKLPNAASLLMLASIGGLLVAFFGSIIPALIPLVLLYRKQRLTFLTGLVCLLSAASAYGVLKLMDHNVTGYGNLPINANFKAVDFAIALGLGLVVSLLGWSLKALVKNYAELAQKLYSSSHAGVAALIFGLVLGILYYIGGETIQFSGSVGTTQLIQHAGQYTVGALIVIVVAKLLATAWSLAVGYRGGLVFPSVYLGVAVALVAASLFNYASPGVAVGSVAGVFGALVGPAVGLIFIAAMVPLKLGGVVIAGIIGSLVGNKIMAKLGTMKPVHDR